MKGSLPALARRPTFLRQISSNPSRRLLLFVMLRSMKFWGVEVKPGQTLKCEPGEHRYLYLSQAALWESKKASGNVQIFVKFNDQKLTLGTLSDDKCPQIKYDLVFEKEFELSHSSKSASVYFCGCKAVQDDGSEGYSGKPEVKEAKANVAKLGGPSAKPKAKAEEAKKVDKPKVDEDGDDGDDSDEVGSDDSKRPDIRDESDEDEEDDSSDEVVATLKKRAAESSSKPPFPVKKAKLISPASGQKTGGDSKKGGHAWTPYPAQPAGSYLLLTARPISRLQNTVARCSSEAARVLTPTTDFGLVAMWEFGKDPEYLQPEYLQP